MLWVRRLQWLLPSFLMKHPPHVCLPFYLAQSICQCPWWVVQVQATVSSDLDEHLVDTLDLVKPSGETVLLLILLFPK